MVKVYVTKSNDAYTGTKEALDALNFEVSGKKRVYIKPNLTGGMSSRKGMTVDIGSVIAVLEKINYCEEIIIGESCSGTQKAFDELGYRELYKEFPNLRLEDIRSANQVWKKIPRPNHTNEMPFNATVLNSDYVINIAKMKTHSLAGVSLSLKNTFGFVPTRKQKLMYHPFIRKAVLDMNQLVNYNLCIVEGIWGNEFDEVQSTPKYTGAIIAGENMLAVDLVAASIMGIDLNRDSTYKDAFELWGKPTVELKGAKLEELIKQYRQGALPSTQVRYVKEYLQSRFHRFFNRH